MIASDLRITNLEGVSFEYYVAQDQINPMVHTKESPNVPVNTGISTPTQAGGSYDVRDSEGDKAITHLDWIQGAGQKSLDGPDAVYSRFLSSKYMDISKSGELKLLRPVVNTPLENTAGPIFGALGKFWKGDALGGLKYTTDNGANWTTCTGYTSTAPISGYATDGTKLYICIPAGSTFSVWVNTAAAPSVFAKYGSTGTTEAIRHLAYSEGFLWGATASGAGVFQQTTGVYVQKTQPSINLANSSVALVSSSNSVYWVTSQGGRSYVYKIGHSFTGETLNVTTEQYAEFPEGFVATCAIGYLSNVDVGGYYESSYSGVGKGTVYRVDSEGTSLLFEIGDTPELTSDPASTDNDNRIWAICSASKDEYVLTNSACYRWDINDGGHSHAFDALGCGSSELITSWNAGSLFSWDGTDGSYGAPSYQFPTGYTATFSVDTPPTGPAAPSWSYNPAGYATMNSAWASASRPVYSSATATTEIVGIPSGGDALSNTTGTIIEVGFGAATHAYTGDVIYSLVVNDGAKQARVAIAGDRGSLYLYAGRWEGGAWVWNPFQIAQDTAFTIKIQMMGDVGSVTYSTGGVPANPMGLVMKSDTATNSIVHTFSAKSQGLVGGALSAQSYVSVDEIKLNNTGAAASGYLTDANFRPSLAYSKGNLMAPYAEAAGNKSLTINAITVESGALTNITTTTDHEIAAGGTQVVNISGSNSTPSIDGNYVATRVDADTFSIPVDVTVAGNGGTVSYNHSTGYTATSTGYSSSGNLTQSTTTFHTGSILKDFRYVSVSHDALPTGSALAMSWSIDGDTGSTIGVTSGKETRFTIDQQGYSIGTTLTITCNGVLSPLIKSVNVVWNFVKSSMHQYILDCRSGAGGGRFSEDSLAAVQHISGCTDEYATFEDRYLGSYTGSIEKMEFLQANSSSRENTGGVVAITVREI